jgi:hypothetical protein
MVEQMVERVKGLIISPAKEWAKIAKEENDVKKLLFSWVLPLLAITLIVSTLGGLMTKYSTLMHGLSSGIVQVLINLAALFLVAFVVNKFAPDYGGKDDFRASFALVVYSLTPAWLAAVCYLIPGLGSTGVMIASLYGLYILYVGINPMKGVPKDKELTYFLICIAAWVAGTIVLSALIFVPLTGLFLEIFDPTPTPADALREGLRQLERLGR